MSNLLSKAKSKILSMKGLMFVVSANSLEKLIHFVTFFGLSLWLLPEDYGLFALAWVVIAIAESFYDFGSSLGYMADYREGKADDLKRAYNGASLLFAVFWVLVCVLFGSIISVLFSNAVGELVIATSVIFLFRGCVLPCMTTFSLNKEYQKLAACQILPAIAGGIGGVIFALSGAGVWALLARYLVAEFTRLILVLALSPYDKRFSIDILITKKWLRSGWKYSLSNNIGWLSVFQVEQVVIGSTLGAATLGIFNFARKPVDIASQTLSQVGKQYFLPSFLTNQKAIKHVINEGLILAGICGLAGILGYVSAKYILLNYWEEQWWPVIEFLPICFALLPIVAMQNVLGAFLASRGESHTILIVECAISALSILMIGILAVGGGELFYFFCATLLANIFKVAAYILYGSKLFFGIRERAFLPE